MRHFHPRAVVCLALAYIGGLQACGEASSSLDASVERPQAPRYGLHGGGGTAQIQSNGLLLDGSSCMGDDALASGLINGIKDATDFNCSSSDVTFDRIVVTAYSTDGTTFLPVSPGDPIQCAAGQTIYLDMFGALTQNAKSTRTDIGLWVSYGGGSALTGSCTQYTLVPGVSGTVTVDDPPDLCGELFAGDTTVVPLGAVAVSCRDDGNGTLAIGTCLGWKTPGSDAICPVSASDQGFRY